MFKTSFSIIVTGVIGIYLAGWAGYLPAGDITEWLPLSALWAFIIMDLLGFFKREAQKLGTDTKAEEPETRGEAFKRKLEEGRKQGYQPEEEVEIPEAIVRMTDQDGNKSMIRIKANGDVETEGDPDPEVIDAMKQLQSSIVQFGPDAIAEELAKHIDKINRGEK